MGFGSPSHGRPALMSAFQYGVRSVLYFVAESTFIRSKDAPMFFEVVSSVSATFFTVKTR